MSSAKEDHHALLLGLREPPPRERRPRPLTSPPKKTAPRSTAGSCGRCSRLRAQAATPSPPPPLPEEEV